MHLYLMSCLVFAYYGSKSYIEVVVHIKSTFEQPPQYNVYFYAGNCLMIVDGILVHIDLKRPEKIHPKMRPWKGGPRYPISR